MPGMGSLYIGVSGLQSNQNALNTTAHNLANVDTTGYVRQQVLMGDRDYNKLTASAISLNQLGLGVSVDAVRQVRDAFADREYRTEAGRAGFYESSYEVMDEIQTLFGELEGVAFQSSLTGLWNAIEKIKKVPNDTVNLELLREKATTFLERAEAVYSGLTEFQDNINTQIQDQITQINEIGQKIYDLNQQIRNIELSGTEHANDLRDTRNTLIDQLSALIKIDYTEDSEGVISIKAENVDFVNSLFVNKIEAQKDPNTGFITPVWSFLDGEPVFDFSNGVSTLQNTDIGSLKAFVLARGDASANYTDIPVAPDASTMTEAEYTAALAEYEQAVEFYNTYTGNSAIMNVQAQFDQLIHGIVTSINDILCPNTTVTDTAGNTYTVLDEANTAYGEDDNKTIGTELFSRKGMERYTQKELTVVVDGVEQTKTYYIFNEEAEDSSVSLYSVKNLEINQDVMKDVTLIPLTTKQDEADYTKGEALAAAWEEKFATLDPNSLSKNNFWDYYKAMVSDIANTGSIYEEVAQALNTTVQAKDAERQQVMGVSSDEELSNMIRFQNAYNASSRYIQVVSEMLEHLVTQLG